MHNIAAAYAYARIGVASYRALGHVPHPLDFKQFIFYAFYAF